MLSQSPRELFEPTPTSPVLKPFATPLTNRGASCCESTVVPLIETETVSPLTITPIWYQVLLAIPPCTEPCASYTQPLAVRCPSTALFVAASMPANLKSVGE